jgi:hypothetical protein
MASKTKDSATLRGLEPANLVASLGKVAALPAGARLPGSSIATYGFRDRFSAQKEPRKNPTY